MNRPLDTYQETRRDQVVCLYLEKKKKGSNARSLSCL